MKKTISMVVILSIVLSMLLFAATALAEDKPVIGVDLYYRRDEYYVDLEATFTNYGAAQGWEMIIQDADGDINKQIQQVEDFITRGVDVIAIAVASPDALNDVIDRAVGAGIPVLCYDGGATTETISTQVIFDYKMNRQLIGDWAVNYINENMADDPEIKVAILDFPPSPIVCQPAADQFQACVEALPNVTVVARQDGKANRTDSMAAAENILTANPDLDIIYGINFDTGAGALSAVQAVNSDCVVICSGWASEGFEWLEAGDKNWMAMCANVPVTQAQDTCDAIAAVLRGEEIPKVYESKPTLLTAENINEFDWESVVAARIS